MTMTVTSIADRKARRIPHNIISVDDHVLEPPDLWSSRLPREFLDRGPRVVRERGFAASGRHLGWQKDQNGNWADVWYYDDLVKPLDRTYAAAGIDLKTLDFAAVTYDDVRPGCWKQAERLADMATDQTEVSICFPNTLPRFCGQTFLEREDKQLALLCVRAYNDWLIDDWTSGPGKGHLIPVVIIPLWDAHLAAEEVRRCANRGAYAVTFSESPAALGLPSLYTDYWDPFFHACEEVNTTVCIHVGSSSRLATTSDDARSVVASTLVFQYGMHSLIDVLFSGLVVRFPSVKFAYSECNVGWMPYILERMDKIWGYRGADTALGGTGLPDPPSSYIRDRIFGCLVDDESGLAARDKIGIEQICYETDYPHVDSLFPHSADNVSFLCETAGLTPGEVYSFVRGNAIRAFGLERYGIRE
jgi:predicted TIM-barrel fold metal-dependent hydrolase